MTGVRNSTQWRLLAVIVLVPIAAVAVLLIWQDYQARRQAVITNLELKSAQINTQLESFVNKAEAATGSLVTLVTSVKPEIPRQSPKSPGSLTGPDHLLTQFLASNPDFAEVTVVDQAGNTLASSAPFTSGIRADYAEFLSTRATPVGFAVSNVFVPAGDAEPYALFSHPFPGSDPSTAYVIARSPLENISGSLDMSTGFPTSAKSGIFDGTGKVLAGTGYELPHPGGAVGRDVSGSAVWAKATESPSTPWFGPGLDKIDRIIFFEYPDQTPWVTTVAFAQAELFGPLWQRVWIVSAALAVTIAGTLLSIEFAVRRERTAWRLVTRERQTLQAVLDSARDGILVLDASGSVEYANGRIGDMFSLSSDRLIGTDSGAVARTLSSMTGLSKRDMAALHDLLSGHGIPSRPLNIGGPETQTLQIDAYPVVRASGEIVGRTIVAHDVTEESRVQRMKSEFLGHASHQLRTPLASILTSSELLLSGNNVPANGKAKLQLVHDEAMRMRETITALLNLSQIESGKVDLDLRTVDLDATLRKVVDSARKRGGPHDFDVSISDSSSHSWADEARLSEVISILLDNAVKYSPDGGRVSVSSTPAPGRNVTIEVRDEGVGIDQSDIPELFSPYHRASARVRGLPGGTGLGLHIARSLVELMGGTVSAQSSIGIGSAFSVTLPATPPAADRIPDEASVDGSSATSLSPAAAPAG